MKPKKQTAIQTCANLIIIALRNRNHRDASDAAPAARQESSKLTMFAHVLKPSIGAVCVLLAMGLPASIHGATLILSNGDRLTGYVVKQSEGKIYFHSDFLGDVVAPQDKARVVESPRQIALSVPGSAPAPQPVAKASAPPAKPPAIAVSERIRPPAPAKPDVKVRRPPWTGKVEFGYENHESTVRTVNATMRATLERTLGRDNFVLKGSYLYGISAGQPNIERNDASFRWRHTMSGRMFAQSLATYNSDKIRLLNRRLEENVGIGYKVLGISRHTVDIGAGVSGLYLDAVGVKPGFGYLANIFQDYTFKINERFTLTEDASVQYSPETPGQFVYVATQTTPLYRNAQDRIFGLNSTLQDKITSRLSLNLRFEYEYESAIPNPSARADERITTSLSVGF